MSRQPVDAARVFSPQKGATPSHVDLLTGRLQRLAQVYETDYGVNVSEMSGSGAAGGLAGGLVALGGVIEPGFDLVADEVGLFDAIEHTDMVITGEGHLDAQSSRAKWLAVSLASQASMTFRWRSSADSLTMMLPTVFRRIR